MERVLRESRVGAATSEPVKWKKTLSSHFEKKGHCRYCLEYCLKSLQPHKRGLSPYLLEDGLMAISKHGLPCMNFLDMMKKPVKKQKHVHVFIWHEECSCKYLSWKKTEWLKKKTKQQLCEGGSGRKKQTVLLGDGNCVPGSCSVGQETRGQETCELIPDLLSQQCVSSDGAICWVTSSVQIDFSRAFPIWCHCTGTANLWVPPGEALLSCFFGVTVGCFVACSLAASSQCLKMKQLTC